MNGFFFAHSQMGMSLAFHIVFAVIGVAMPLLMAVSEGCYLWTKKRIFLELSKRWATGTAILFAVGAVSGTVLSFELGLLWPKFMQYAAGIIGMPFSLEGFAFFTDSDPQRSRGTLMVQTQIIGGYADAANHSLARTFTGYLRGKTMFLQR
jgi:cytochrome d ubiquinol oxidase subunit I